MFGKALRWSEKKIEQLSGSSKDEDDDDEDGEYVTSDKRQTHNDGFKGICKIGNSVCAVQSHHKAGQGIVVLDCGSIMKNKRRCAEDCEREATFEVEDREPKGLVVVNDSITYLTCMQNSSKIHSLHYMVRQKGKKGKVVRTVIWPEKYLKSKTSPKYLCYHDKTKFVYAVCGNGMVFRTRLESNKVEMFAHTGHAGARNICFGLGTSSDFMIVTGKNYVAVFDMTNTKTRTPIFFQFFQKTSRDRRLFRVKPFRNNLWFEKAGNKFRKVCMIDGTMILLHSYGIAVVAHDFIEAKKDGTYSFVDANCADHRIYANLSGEDPHDMVPIYVDRSKLNATLAVTVTGPNEIRTYEVDLFMKKE